MDLVLAEPLVDAVDGMHEPFLFRAVVGLLRSKQIQLHPAVALQQTQDHAGLFVLIAGLIDPLQEGAYRLHDRTGIVGWRRQLERVVHVVLRQVGTMTISSEEDRYRPA